MENGKIARATHNVAAWRLWDVAKGVQLHDNDDDGEYPLLVFVLCSKRLTCILVLDTLL